MQVERVMIDELDCDPANVRAHDSKNLDAIKSSLKRFGQQKPIVVNEKGIVIAGNGTLTAARALGWDSINIITTELDGVNATAYAIADNRTGELAEWDNEALAKQLSALQIEDEALVEAAGFSDAELTALVDEVTGITEGNTDPDEVPEVPEEPTAQAGQIWQLGSHRLMCGDSTSAEDVAALMDGQKADMVFTDPPYGISLGFETPKQAKARNRRTDGLVVENDNLKDDELQAFLTTSICLAAEHTSEGGAFYVCSPIGKEVKKFIQAWEDSGLHYQSGLVWNKSSLSLSRHDYHPKHEIIHYGWKKGAAHRWLSDRKQTSVFDFQKPSRSESHPTSKPVGLVLYFVGNVSQQKDSVLDLFLGSGSTLIACEQTGRKCYGMELSPAYCDVIVKRWEDFTGQTAELVNG
tara:strand:- start:10 stop:1236 length:1227 start_codon:yes stop_codon:yes gene_type:complete